MYLLRLDDACEYRSIENWSKMESLLDKYSVKPIVGIIPKCKDEKLCLAYKKDDNFWATAKKWNTKHWELALHGYEHVFTTNDGGINPVNKRSEFAGVNLDEQKRMLSEGSSILKEHNIFPKIFFAPAHTFDNNTITALKDVTDIRIISDTVANDIYFSNQVYFIPQQTGRVRKLPFKTVTFCYHPNTMVDSDFEHLELFLSNNKERFISFEQIKFTEKKYSVFDALLSYLYFLRK